MAEVAVVQIDCSTGKVLAKYDTIVAAARAANTTSSGIRRCLLKNSTPGRQHQAGGFIWITNERYEFLKSLKKET